MGCLSIRMGTDVFALVGSLQSLVYPGNCFSCTKLRLTFRPDGYESVCSAHKNKVRMFSACSVQITGHRVSLRKQLEASGGQVEGRRSVFKAASHMCSLLQGCMQWGHLPCPLQPAQHAQEAYTAHSLFSNGLCSRSITIILLLQVLPFFRKKTV